MKCSNKLELLWLCFKGFGEKWNQIHIRKYSLQCTFLRDNNEDVQNKFSYILANTAHCAGTQFHIKLVAQLFGMARWYFDLCFDRPNPIQITEKYSAMQCILCICPYFPFQRLEDKNSII